MTPALRQALVVGAFATLCAVSATLGVNALSRSPIVLATPTVTTNPGTVYSPGNEASDRPWNRFHVREYSSLEGGSNKSVQFQKPRTPFESAGGSRRVSCQPRARSPVCEGF